MVAARVSSFRRCAVFCGVGVPPSLTCPSTEGQLLCFQFGNAWVKVPERRSLSLWGGRPSLVSQKL